MMCLDFCLGTPPSFTGASWNTSFLLDQESLAEFEGVWMIKLGDKAMNRGERLHLYHCKNITLWHHALSVTAELSLPWDLCFLFPYTAFIWRWHCWTKALKDKQNLSFFFFFYQDLRASHAVGNSFWVPFSTAQNLPKRQQNGGPGPADIH